MEGLEKKASENFAFIPVEAELADVILSDNKNNLYKCHSLFLKVHSPIFRETNFVKDKIIPLNEEPSILIGFMKLLYFSGGTLDDVLNNENVVGLWKFFHKYQMGWIHQCYEIISKMVTDYGYCFRKEGLEDKTKFKLVEIIKVAKELRSTQLYRKAIDVLVTNSLKSEHIVLLDETIKTEIIIHYNNKCMEAIKS